MGASSVTGVSGHGSSGKATTNELSRWANGPTILMSGVVASTEGVSSPPSPTGEVTFPTALSGSANDYVVILTTIGGGSAYVVEMIEEDDQFTGFSFITQEECDCMFAVVKAGIRAI